MHLHTIELRLGRHETVVLFPYANQFASEDADVLVGLLGHGGVALGAFGGLLDKRLGFLFRGFELLDVAVEFADILADEGVAFALLGGC